jgi:hypothetical protein
MTIEKHNQNLYRDLIDRAKNNPNQILFIGYSSYEVLKKMIHTHVESVGGTGYFNWNSSVMRFKNGSKILCVPMSKMKGEENYEHLHGLRFNDPSCGFMADKGIADEALEIFKCRMRKIPPIDFDFRTVV